MCLNIDLYLGGLLILRQHRHNLALSNNESLKVIKVLPLFTNYHFIHHQRILQKI